MVENTDQAIAKASLITACEVVDYTVAPIFMKDKEKGAHEWMIEFKKKPEDIGKFQKTLDEILQTLNSDYEAKRYNNMTLNPLVINVARENLFYDWLKDQNKLGGQHKIPRLSNKRDYLEQLKNMQVWFGYDLLKKLFVLWFYFLCLTHVDREDYAADQGEFARTNRKSSKLKFQIWCNNFY